MVVSRSAVGLATRPPEPVDFPVDHPPAGSRDWSHHYSFQYCTGSPAPPSALSRVEPPGDVLGLSSRAGPARRTLARQPIGLAPVELGIRWNWAWYAGDPSILEGDFETTQITTAKVTSDFFRVLQVEAALGRTFGEQEIDDQAQVVVISHDLWRRRFGSDPEVVGSQLQIDGTAREIIGVMPPRFRIPNREVGLWIPWNLVAEYARLGGVPRDYRFLRVVGWLATDQSIDSARSEMAGLARRLESFPENQGWTVRLAPFQAHLLERFQSPLLILLVAVLLVLSITSLNVANIQLSRMSVRTPELALRAVLGSPPGRLLSQSLMENLVLVVAGGGMGIALAYLSLAPVLRLAPPGSSLSRSDSD